jgi:putative endonuclease
MFKVYLLYSEKKGKFYIGKTSDILEERIRRHNTNHKGFTGGVLDWRLVYSETFSDDKSASQREKELKLWKSSRRLRRLAGMEI